jgi:hypothetical protein
MLDFEKALAFKAMLDGMRQCEIDRTRDNLDKT